MRYLKSKYKKAKCALKEKFAESVAPGQASCLVEILSSSNEEDSEELPDELENLLEIYKSSDKFGKMVALNLASQKHSKTFIMKSFECSKRKVDDARKIISDGIHVPEVTKHTRSRLDLNKCQHFLDFIFNNWLLQDVAYGTSTLRYESGESQTVPHAVIVARFKPCRSR